MYETYSWMEGQVYLWTGGGASASGVIAFAQNTDLAVQRGWMNIVTVGGSYTDHLTGRRADVTIGALMTYDSTVTRIDDAETAVHMKFQYNNINGSAGVLLYSGRIDRLQYAGSEENPYQWTLQAHFNQWSGF